MAGASGAGKSTLARRLSTLLGVRYVELDALFHGPGWVRRDSFVADVESFSSGAAWVTEWQYGVVRGLLADRADLMIWLDLPRGRVLRQVVSRTVRRRVRREQLWNGNFEPPLWTVLTDPANVVRWSWSTYPKVERLVAELADRRPELPVVRFTRHRAVDRWLDGALAASTPPASDDHPREPRQPPR